MKLFLSKIKVVTEIMTDNNLTEADVQDMTAKDFFDRCYDDLKDKTEGLPIIYYVRAGLDGEGCKVALNKILIGLRWRQVLPPLILKGSWQKDYLKQLEKFVLTFTSGIELGIY